MQIANVQRLFPLFLTAACVALGGCDHSTSSEAAPATSASSAEQPEVPASTPTRPEDLADQMRPKDQVDMERLLKAVIDAESPSGNAFNDETNFMKAFKAYCSQMQKNGTFTNWTAVVKEIYPGDPHSESSKNPSMNLITPGGLEVYEELRPNTPIYDAVLKLKEGDYVTFSIAVTHIEKSYGGSIYDECQDPMYHSDRGAHVNKFLIGDLKTIAPI